MSFKLLDRAKVNTATTGPGDITLGAATDAFYQTFAAAGMTDGDTTFYCIEDGGNWEIGLGTYTASGAVLARTTVYAGSNSTSPITLSGSAVVFGAALAAHLLHSNKNILDAITASFTTAQETKLGYISVTQAVDLDQIESDMALFINGGMIFKDDWDASSGSFPGGGVAQAGWQYYVSTGGTVDSVEFSAGDTIVARVDNASTTTYSPNWRKHDQTDAVQSVAGLTGSIAKAALLAALNVEDGADVTDTANVTAAGALMDSECANLAAVKAINQGLATTDSPTFAAATVTDLAVSNVNGLGVSTGDSAIEIGRGRTGNGNGYLDLHTQASQDFNLRFSRGLGADGPAQFQNTGAGPMQFRQINAGLTDFLTTNVIRMQIAAAGGVVIKTAGADPTGGNQGDGTLNASALYDDNSLVADMVKEWQETGRHDVQKWHDMVPDYVVPEHIEEKPVMVDVTVEEDYEVLDADGDSVRKVRTVTRKRQAKTLRPIYDEKGNGIDAVEEDVTEPVTVPEVRIARKHPAAEAFAELLDGGFDPTDPSAFIAKVRQRGTLPCLPNKADMEARKFSLGELDTRNRLASEIFVAAFEGAVKRIDDLEARLSALEQRGKAVR